VRAAGATPPLTLAELRQFAHAALADEHMPAEFADFAAVLVSNELWRDRVAAVPYERRLLMLPQCLRDAANCRATIDEFGLFCRHCGRCVLDGLLAEAEQLGYATLVAEGTIVVTSLIRTNRIDAVVGAGCLASLERIFPYMEAAACAGIAVPLLHDGCIDTELDVEWIREAIHLRASDAPAARLDLDATRERVAAWFTPDALAEALGRPAGPAERIAHDWLASGGKRWRPFLTACVHEALTGGATGDADDLRKVALAVECFHKASLIHDDIEDGDAARYGAPTLHASHGLPVALNVGDLLIGEGYRLLTELDAPSDVKAAMLAVAARAHRELCIGQGAELSWTRDPRPVSAAEAIEVFRMKTAPAFEVSLKLGAMLAGAAADVCDALGEYSSALGIAYQVADDLADARADLTGPLRLSLPLAVAWERAGGAGAPRDVARAAGSPAVIAACEDYLQAHRQRAVESLRPMDNPELKSLLRRTLAKIFCEVALEDGSTGIAERHVGGGKPVGEGPG
jgi:geranylgeranyl pyrophosphate synthase